MMHYYFLLFSCSLFLSLPTLLEAAPMYQEGKESAAAEHQQAEQKTALHQRQLTELEEEENPSALEQRNRGPLAVAESRKDLKDYSASEESRELTANPPPRDVADRSRTITVNKRPVKIKSIKDQLGDCERNLRIIRSGLEIAIDDVSEDDPQKARTIATLHEATYFPMKENLERTLILMKENHAVQERANAILLAKLAFLTIEIASRSIAVENLNSAEDHESTMINASARDACRNFLDLMDVLNASNDDIGNKLHECQINIAKRAFAIAQEKLKHASRKKKELSRNKIKASLEALAQAEMEVETTTSSYAACGEAVARMIKSSVPITDPDQARIVAIDQIINLAQSVVPTANDIRTMLTLQKEN